MTEVATLIAVVLKLERGGFLGPSILSPPTNELNDIAEAGAAHAVLRNLNMN